MTEAQKNLIKQRLYDRSATLPCPRCGATRFALEDQIVMTPVQTNLQGYQLGGITIPAAITSCNNCGWLAFHALGTLDLLEHPAFGGKRR